MHFLKCNLNVILIRESTLQYCQMLKRQRDRHPNHHAPKIPKK